MQCAYGDAVVPLVSAWMDVTMYPAMRLRIAARWHCCLISLLVSIWHTFLSLFEFRISMLLDDETYRLMKPGTTRFSMWRPRTGKRSVLGRPPIRWTSTGSCWMQPALNRSYCQSIREVYFQQWTFFGFPAYIMMMMMKDVFEKLLNTELKIAYERILSILLQLHYSLTVVNELSRLLLTRSRFAFLVWCIEIEN